MDISSAVLVFLGRFNGQYVLIIGLKAPGNYSDQFWSNETSVLLCEGPKPQNAMISDFLGPEGPLIY